MTPLSLRYLGPTSFAAEFGTDGVSPDGLSIDSSSAGIESSNRLQLARRMYSASEVILQVCKMLTPTNDLFLWLVYEDMALSDIIHGASSETLWGQLGDLSTN
ncbi:hypothetical protein TMatcc_004907 [Talaromyces marneffei ATCC 18224]|nr:hypothetical protein EYB25_002162 [Talaromyces marneffei]